MASLKEKTEQILNDKNTNLLPENLKEGIICLGISGVLKELDTSDATAESIQIQEGQTAYVNRRENHRNLT